MSSQFSQPLKDDSTASVNAVNALDAVPSILELLRTHTGMRFAAVARVTDDKWLACASQDYLGLGVGPGTLLDIDTTLCKESRLHCQTIAFDNVATNEKYRDHHTPRLYKLQSYISTPIILPDGTYFGNLCALDTEPKNAESAHIQALFTAYATLIGQQLGGEDKIRALSDELELEKSLAQARERFLAVVAHDLRNPLSTVRTAADILCRRNEPSTARIGSRLASTAARMQGLIDDLGDFARGRAGKVMSVALAEHSNLGDALVTVLEEVQIAAPNHAFGAKVDLPEPVICDPARIQQLVGNLLGNAVTYGDAGHSILLEASQADGETVIAVTNGGPPIDAQKLSHLFDPYWRASSQSPEQRNMGLGLYICREIALAHGGTISVTSDDLEGTKFTLRFPTRCPANK